ncbi:hypothetical protein NHX12_030433 [Muraenolepis orangiensis]|uniref:Uncharacterized protein n=1 Tax=Muraenolepis orangiensis TaxID=630683 RepID=A0A9Q0E9T9_9TELE|nr:hypothetical protein NHX12_030433 [Muraenolepis orangiensis]
MCESARPLVFPTLQASIEADGPTMVLLLLHYSVIMSSTQKAIWSAGFLRPASHVPLSLAEKHRWKYLR